jgi:hypothetical protein
VKRSLRSAVCEVIYAQPGLTQTDVAKAIYGSAAYPGQVARVCAELLEEGLIQRHGRGGPADPFVYFWRLRHQVCDGAGQERPAL